MTGIVNQSGSLVFNQLLVTHQHKEVFSKITDYPV